MFLWQLRFETLQPLDPLPRLDIVAAEEQYDASYRHEGKNRGREKHCLFKYTLDGVGIFRDGRGEHRVPANHGFLCEICDPQTAYYYPADARGPWRFVYLCFTGEWVTEAVHALTRRHGGVFMLEPGSPVIRRMLAYEQEDGTHRAVTASEGARIVFDLLAALGMSREAGALNEPGNRLVRQAQEAIREHVADSINVADIAKMLTVSREHLTRMFKEQAGMTPHQFIVREKLLLACRLLKSTTLTNKEIAARLGFSTSAHFTRTFRRGLTMTPSQFRETGALPVVL